jgi:hypothetical protein
MCFKMSLFHLYSTVKLDKFIQVYKIIPLKQVRGTAFSLQVLEHTTTLPGFCSLSYCLGLDAFGALRLDAAY